MSLCMKEVREKSRQVSGARAFLLEGPASAVRSKHAMNFPDATKGSKRLEQSEQGESIIRQSLKSKE